MQDHLNVYYVHMHMYFQFMSFFSFLSVFLSKTEPVSIHAPHTRFETNTWPVSQKPGHTVTVSSGFLISSVRHDRSVLVTSLHCLCLKTYLRAPRLLFWPSYTHAAFLWACCYQKNNVYFVLKVQFVKKKLTQHFSFHALYVWSNMYVLTVKQVPAHKITVLFKYLNHF